MSSSSATRLSPRTRLEDLERLVATIITGAWARAFDALIARAADDADRRERAQAAIVADHNDIFNSRATSLVIASLQMSGSIASLAQDWKDSFENGWLMPTAQHGKLLQPRPHFAPSLSSESPAPAWRQQEPGSMMLIPGGHT